MEEVQDLKERLAPVFMKYKVLAAYLFGSRSEGRAHPGSDYDIACLLEEYDPKKNNFDFVSSLQAEIEEKLEDAVVDVILLEKAPVALQYTVISSGVVIYNRDDDARTDFEDRVIRDYLDFKPFLDQYDREALEAIQGGSFFA